MEPFNNVQREHEEDTLNAILIAQQQAAADERARCTRHVQHMIDDQEGNDYTVSKLKDVLSWIENGNE